MMRLCPTCRNVSYGAGVTWDTLCPVCGFDLGQWMEKRTSRRLGVHYPGSITHMGSSYQGYTINISDTGARVLYKGRAFHPGDEVELKVKDTHLEKKATVVWSRQIYPDICHTGLKLL